MQNNNSLLTINNLVKYFDISGGLLDQLSIEQKRIVRRRTTVKALNDVSLWINLELSQGLRLGRVTRVQGHDLSGLGDCRAPL